MQHAVAKLSTVHVVERDGVRYSGEEWRAYCDGYYRALAQAIAVMDLAIEQRRLRFGAPREVKPCPKTTNHRMHGRSAPTVNASSNGHGHASAAPSRPARATRARSRRATASSTQ